MLEFLQGQEFDPKGRQVEFNGASNQTITGSTAFAYLKINNNAGITLANDISVSNDLDLANGSITTGTNMITVSGAITNATSTKYIVGKLARVFGTTGSKDFPIGKGWQLSSINNQLYCPHRKQHSCRRAV
ncbi:MAG: hypothetical protein IPH88_05840 [Bacteroidales bacterium]|nr:hypothetical protein [Bacteroidales bacterium]